MIPSTNKVLTTEFTVERQPSLNYKMALYDNFIAGKWDNLEAMKQVVYKILMTERYQYLIYSWNYGVELEDLFGMPVSYVVVELENRIKEALTQDDRIEDVFNFEFDISKRHVVSAYFTVETIFGSFQAERTVEY